MIEVGDKLLIGDKVETVKHISDTGVYVEESQFDLPDGDYCWEAAYASAHDYEKRRADQYEKLWNELKEKLNSVFEKNETHFIEDLVYCNVLETMNELEEKMC